MIASDILTAVLLGFIGGITPGPIILLAFSEILRSPKKGLVNGMIYLTYAGLTEFCVGLFLIITSSILKIPLLYFHYLSIIGIAILIYLVIKLLQINKIEYNEKGKSIKPKHIILLMIFNGPMWLFWLSVCLPTAFNLGSNIVHGEYLFIVVFEISMMTGLAIILFGFNSFRNHFTNPKLVRRIFLVLSILLMLLIVKMAYSEIVYFASYL